MCKRSVMDTFVLSNAQMLTADVNSDGVVDKYDYILIKRHVMGTLELEENPGNDAEPEYIPNVVSAGKQYSLSVAADKKYEDSYNCELTDGIYNHGTSYYSGAFCGFSASVEIIVDLENDSKNLYRFELSYLNTNDAGIGIPSSILVSGSDDMTKWQSIGKLNKPEFKEGTVTQASLELSDSVDYRYIRFAVSRSSSWVFIDELFVYSRDLKIKPTVKDSIQYVYNNSKLQNSVVEANRKAVLTGAAFDLANGTSAVSVGKQYTASCKKYDWRSGYDETILTNGNPLGSAFENKEWVGFSLESENSITIDLGEIRNDLYAFELHCFYRTLAGINLPPYCDVLVSDDGKSFKLIGRTYAYANDEENVSFCISFSELIKARYVRFAIPKGEGYCWIEEALVYANCKEEEKAGMLYGDFEMSFVSTPKYWQEGSDYNTEKNLLLNLTQEIFCNAYLDYDTYAKNNTLETSTLLTDGKYSDSTYCYNGKWFHFNSGEERLVFYDLGAISSVSEFSVSILDFGDWGISLPEYVRVVLSENGTDWYTAADVIPVSNVGEAIKVSGKFSKSYRARYVMFNFDVVGHVFIDEITLAGKKNASSASSLVGLPEFDINKEVDPAGGYAAPSEDLLGGVKDVALIYHNTSNMNEEFFIPYVAYVDEEGNIKDTLFDGYLFLPSTGSLPSGGRPYGTNVASDWNYLFDEIFAKGKNFEALDNACETVKSELGLTENKLKVFVTIPHMDTSLEAFGDIDFDGKNESLTTLAGRVYVAKYYAERVIKEFNSRKYKNLELCGFYWFHEEIHGEDVTTAKEVNKMFDEIGYQLFWIPYYNAAGYGRWEEFGFDVGCLQPNYAFSLDVRETRIETATVLAKRYGMCIEMEIQENALYDIRFFKKYMGYLMGGVEYGYMKDAIHMYYQGGSIFRSASLIKGEYGRLVYDYTYQFIKGTLDPTPEKLPDINVNAKVNTVYSGKLNANDTPYAIYKSVSSPKHGSLTIAENGEFIYCPFEGFKGTDTFTFQYGMYLGWSEEITVTVNVY
jgi:hypothetical protein